MKNLQEATERICDLKGSLVALDALVPAVMDALSAPARAKLMASFDAHAEAARTVLLHADLSDVVLAAFERDVARNRALLRQARGPGVAGPDHALLLATTHISACEGERAAVSGSGFFFRRGERLFLVSCRELFAEAGGAPGSRRIEFGLHTDPQDLAQHLMVSLPLYDNGLPLWRDAGDGDGAANVAAIEIPAGRLPAQAVLHAFDESHLEAREETVDVGDALTIAGFPLGLHDTVHHLAVAQGAYLASAYGVRFERRNCFLTDARMRRGSCGSPVVRRRQPRDRPAASLRSWQLLGVHSRGMGRGAGEPAQDDAEAGLNRAWYADVLVGLTGDA